jgi:hypothetical protein
MNQEVVTQAFRASEKLVEQTLALIQRMEERNKITYAQMAETDAAIRECQALLNRLGRVGTTPLTD